MPTNPYFRQAVRSEQSLYEDIIIECLKMYGQDLYYLPRDIVNEDRVFGDDVPSRFNSSYKIEMYIENIEGFEGEGDLFSRFGVEIRDEATFIVSRKRWREIIGRRDNNINSDRPREGDLIYTPMSKSLFQIMHVEHEQPFYQLGNLPTYKMRCALFEYNDEDFDTGVAEIDDIEIEAGYRYEITLTNQAARALTLDTTQENIARQYLDSNGLILSGEINRFSSTDKRIFLSHVGANDGSFRQFDPTKPIRINDVNYEIDSISEVSLISPNQQNADFNTESISFLDFTETNPFGEPENS